MTSHYTVKILSNFASAHSLRDYPGECRRVHGHNWKVEVEVGAQSLDELGMVVDFKELRKATESLTNRLDHYYLNDVEPFDRINPTAENIARYLYQELSNQFNNERVHLISITLWETERACARYAEE